MVKQPMRIFYVCCCSAVKNFWFSFWFRANSEIHSEFFLIQRNSEDIDSEFCSDSVRLQNQYTNCSENVLNQYWKTILFWKCSDSVLMPTECKVRALTSRLSGYRTFLVDHQLLQSIIPTAPIFQLLQAYDICSS